MISIEKEFPDECALTVDEEMGRSLSQVMRRARLDDNKTLKEQSQGICSLSYLCKLENNTIQPSEWYLRSLFEKMNLDYDKSVALQRTRSVDHALACFLAEDQNGLNEIMKGADPAAFEVKMSIARCLVAYFAHDSATIAQELARIDSVRKTLTQSEIFATLLINGLGHFMEGAVRAAMEYFRELWRHLPDREHYLTIALVYGARGAYVLHDALTFEADYARLQTLPLYELPRTTEEELFTDHLVMTASLHDEETRAHLTREISRLSGREKSRAVLAMSLIALQEKSYRALWSLVREHHYESDPLLAPVLVMSAVVSNDALLKKDALTVMEPLLALEKDPLRSLFFALARKKLLGTKLGLDELHEAKTRLEALFAKRQDHVLTPALMHLMADALEDASRYKELLVFLKAHPAELAMSLLFC